MEGVVSGLWRIGHGQRCAELRRGPSRPRVARWRGLHRHRRRRRRHCRRCRRCCKHGIAAACRRHVRRRRRRRRQPTRTQHRRHPPRPASGACYLACCCLFRHDACASCSRPRPHSRRLHPRWCHRCPSPPRSSRPRRAASCTRLAPGHSSDVEAFGVGEEGAEGGGCSLWFALWCGHLPHLLVEFRRM